MSMRQIKITKSITNRESPCIEKYLQEIGKVELISGEEEAELSRKIRKGDQHAFDKLTKANLRFVVSVAKQYQNQGMPLADLINEGNLGLIKAAWRFDESKGFRFISYAVWWIRQSILKALAEHSRIVRLPLNKVGLSNRIQKAFTQLEQEYEREPSPEELANFLEMNTEEVSATLGITGRHVSMDTPLSDDEDNTLLDVMANPNAESAGHQIEYNESLKLEINRSLTALTGRQKDVICSFFGIGVEYPMSLEDIADHYKVTRERVRQIKDKAITKLRLGERYNILRPYLESIS